MISLVIPAYNEAGGLMLLYERLLAASSSWGRPFEVILVNDGSRDRTLEVMLEIHRRDARFKIIDLTRNFGHQAALATGLSYASGECVIVLDADLQDPPEILDQFLAKWQEGYDIVYGVRTQRPEGLLKRTCYYLYYRLLQWLADIPIPPDAGDFCLMSRRVVEVLNRLPERVRLIRGLRSWIGFQSIGIPYQRQAREEGHTKYSWRRLIRLGLSGILSFSKFPLRIASIAGLSVAGLSFAAAFLFLVMRLTGWTPLGYDLAQYPGMTTLVISLYFLAGIMLICLGIIGEYLGQVVEEVKYRPLALVRRTYGLAAEHLPSFVIDCSTEKLS
jgi:dolichol-phosphate mannosyltransferase